MEERKLSKKEKRAILDSCAGAWGPGESGVAYVRRIRDDNRREKRLGIR